MRKKVHILLVILIVLLSGCAQTKNFVPQPINANYNLHGMPKNMVSVEVNDLRAERTNSEALGQVIKNQIINALSVEKIDGNSEHYTLSTDIIEHRAFFTLGNWNASTKFRIKLLDSKNNIIGSWNASGVAHRSNLWGYATAKAVTQDAFNNAIADLMSILSNIDLTIKNN